MLAGTSLKRRIKRRLGRVASLLQRQPPQPGVRCLVYHAIVPNRQADSDQMTTPVDLFEKQMAYLASHGFSVEPAARVVESFVAGRAPAPKTIVLTFDDGFDDLQQLALPVLQRFGFPATCFVMTAALDGRYDQVHNGWAGSYLTWSQAKALQASGLVSVGCHGATHRRLAGLPPERLSQEIADAKRRLEDGLQQPVPLFAYPFGSYGSWDASVRRAVEQAGFLGAVTSIAGLNTASTDRFLMRRCRVSWCDDVPDEFARVVSGAYDWYALVQRFQGRYG